jgi:hypothetical protein
MLNVFSQTAAVVPAPSMRFAGLENWSRVRDCNQKNRIGKSPRGSNSFRRFVKPTRQAPKAAFLLLYFQHLRLVWRVH